MTPQERQILEEAENQAFDTSQQLEDIQLTSGIRPPPEVTETESTLEGQLFGLDFGQDPQASVLPGASVPIPSGGGCCTIASVQLIVELSGCVNLLVLGDCLCNTFDCTFNHTWTPVSDPCSANQTFSETGIDNSGCISCEPMSFSTPWGTTDYTVTIFPFSGPATVEVNINPEFECGAFPGDAYCGINSGGCNLGYTANWITTDTCPIGTYHIASTDGCGGSGTLNYDITLIIS